LTSPAPEPGAAAGLRVAWFGHAVGARADGLTTYSTEVVGGLRQRGAEVWFHHATADRALLLDDLPNQLAWQTWRFKTVTVPRRGFRPGLSRWLADTRPDVVHTSLSFTMADGWLGSQARRAGAATVATFHLPFGRRGSAREVVMRQLHRFWAPRLRPYQRVIVFSEDHRNRLSEAGVPRSTIEVLPNAVDTARFRPGVSELRHRRLLGSGMVLGYAGRLDPEKGVRELLEGFRAADLGPEARLLIAGRGALERQVREAQRDVRVIYLGQLSSVSERCEFWRAVDLFCLPSSAEGLSIALLEAMASGCAVAATPAGGSLALPEVATELDPVALSHSIANLLNNLHHRPGERERQGRVAREEAVRHHGLAAMLDRLLAIYQDCQNLPPSGRPPVDRRDDVGSPLEPRVPEPRGRGLPGGGGVGG